MLKKIFPFIIGTTLILTLSISSYASSIDNSSSSISNPSSIENSNSSSTEASPTNGSDSSIDDSTVAIVDGQKISKSFFMDKKKLRDATSNVQKTSATVEKRTTEHSDQQLLQALIKEQVILNNCKREGLHVSRDEAKKALEDTDKTEANLIENGSSYEKQAAQLAKEQYESFLNALGMSKDEYYEKYGIDVMQSVLLRNSYYQHFTSNLTQKDLSIKQIDDLYLQHVQDLIDKSDIKINQALLNN